MDFEFTEEQKMFRAAVRDFLKTECPPKLVRQVEDAGLQEFLPVYRKMGQLGFLGVGFPEEYGGSGGSWLDLALLCEEAGGALTPNIHLSSLVLSGQAILRLGNDQQKKMLPALIRGETITAPAWMEDGANPRLCNLQTEAVDAPEGVAVRGRKGMVGHFDVATHFLVTAIDKGKPSRDGDPAGNDAIRLVLVDAARTEIACHALRLQSGEVVADVDFQDAPADSDACIACRWADWLRLIDRAKIALAAYCLGAARAALDMGVAYAKERVQFGKPIGTFQAIQHKLAEAACSIELAKIAVYHAAWLCDQQDDWEGEAAAAKLLAGEAVGRAAHNSALTHGAYGFSMDNDIQFYFRRIKALQHEIEGPEIQKELIATGSGF